MTTASGILFVTNKEKPTALFLKRNAGAKDFPLYWCWPGGHVEPEDKDIEATAVREAEEECGKIPKGPRTLLTRSISQPPLAPVAEGAEPTPVEAQIDFTTFFSKVDEEFSPKLDGEHVAWTWCPIDTPPEPLHPGCRIALDRLSMHELDVAKAIADGRLTSPQVYENVTLFAIRITGTGAAYRRAHDEYVWRDPELYLNDDFLARCNGLPVIFEHPKDALLNSTEFNDRAIGTILLPYINNDEVWGIAKIYDRVAIKIMMEDRDDISTSPAVSWRDLSVNTVLKNEDGSKLLVEGQPSIVDHIAVVTPRGVWDKGGDAAGVRVDKQITMVHAVCVFPTAKLDLALSKARNMRIDAALQRFCG